MKAAELGAATREEALRIAHDVGKHVARTARNLPEAGAVPAVLVDMLVKDLYALSGGERASAVLAARANALAVEDEVKRAGALLQEADGLEGAVRAGDDAAVRRAAAIALEVEAALRGLLSRVAAAESGGGGAR